MFRVNRNQGFHITFKNGVTLSTQIGPGNYCNNRYNNDLGDFTTKCENAEIALWNENGNWITREVMRAAGFADPCDDVVGHVDIEKWLKILKAAETF